MVNFSSIDFYLQLKITEKVDYLDLKEFKLSSKLGKACGDMRKNKGVVHVSRLEMRWNDLRIQFKTPEGQIKRSWIELRKVSSLPQLMVTSLVVWNLESLNYIVELSEMAGFCRNPVTLCWPKYCGAFVVESFEKLTEMFNIKSFNAYNVPDGCLWTQPKFLEIECLRIPVTRACIEELLQLKSSKLHLRNVWHWIQISSVVNRLFQEWFQKIRNIHYFEIIIESYANPKDTKMLFDALPYSILWPNQERKCGKKVTLIMEGFRRRKHCELSLGGAVYSIDRGDKKLLVYVSGAPNRKIIAQEYVDLKDIPRFHVSRH